jgi:hypothetical protein
LNIREFLKSILYRREDVDDWLSGKRFVFWKYDPEVGYVETSRRCEHGVDGSVVTYTYDKKFLSRRTINYPDEPCRINSYGDSYTHGAQVNDGETWPEILAAHLGEPIRNFGTSGFSVFQAYLRMIKEESRIPAKYIIMNIYDDDHFRNLIGWRRLKYGIGKTNANPPQPYVRANPTTKEFQEFSHWSNPENLYELCDLDRTYERFKDDFFTHVMLAKINVYKGTPADSYKDVEQLAEEYGLRTKIRSPKKLLRIANKLYTDSAIFASMRIVEKIEKFASARGKKILYVGSYSPGTVAGKLKSGQGIAIPEYEKPGYSFNQTFRKFMKDKGQGYVDLLDLYARDFAKTKMSVQQYLKQFYVSAETYDSHYSPRGNYFTAFALKDRLVEMLDPKPPSYRPLELTEDEGICVSLSSK